MKDKKIYVFMTDGFEEIEALTVVDLLRRDDLNVNMVSLSGNIEIEGSHGIKIKADSLFEGDYADADAIVLPGGPQVSKLVENEKLNQVIKSANERKVIIAAICAAPKILARLGILDGKTACCYPTVENELSKSKVTYSLYELDDNILTSRGAGTAMHFAFKLISIVDNDLSSDKIKNSIQF